MLKTLLRSRASLIGILAGGAYGITARLVAQIDILGPLFGVMTIGFLFMVPITLGVITVSAVERPSWPYRLFAPWIPTILVVAVAAAIGWEGSICIVMALPVLLIFASLGGMIAGIDAARAARPVLIVLPFLTGPFERRFAIPVRLVDTVREIRIAAPPSVVWPLITSVDSIRPSEQEPALFIRLGFPRPISARISGAGVGAVRSARFERGLVFTETVTQWDDERLLSFRIKANTDSIPPTTLDPHVTIGGPFFDVLSGTYELHPINGGRSTRLVLRSRYRVSTRFNLYSGWWADRIMASIQENILKVHRARAERLARTITDAESLP